MRWRSAIEALGRRRIGPVATGRATAGFDADCDTKTNDGPPSGGVVVVTDGAAAKLSIARSAPAEQSVSATIARALKTPDMRFASIGPSNLNRDRKSVV